MLACAPARANLSQDCNTTVMFKDPRWSRVRCLEPPQSWDRLLTHHDLVGILASSVIELDADQTLASLAGTESYVNCYRTTATIRTRWSKPCRWWPHLVSDILVPWTDAQLDRLHAEWIGLAKAAWRLPPSLPSAPFTFPQSQGGSPVPHPRVYLVQALSMHVEQLVALPDDLRATTVEQYRQLCAETGCHAVRELSDFLSRERRPRPCPIAPLLRVRGQLNDSVQLPACLSLGPGERGMASLCAYAILPSLTQQTQPPEKKGGKGVASHDRCA